MARYPEDTDALSRMLTDEVCRKLIDDTKLLQLWIKENGGDQRQEVRRS